MSKYLKKFENHSDYEEYMENPDYPNVSICAEEEDVHYNVPSDTSGTFTVANN